MRFLNFRILSHKTSQIKLIPHKKKHKQTPAMIDINKLFGDGKEGAIAFYNEEHTLTPDERMKLHSFYEGTYKTTTVAKSFMGISAGLTMVWLARRKRKINPLMAMIGGIGLSAFVFSFMTPTIYANKLRELEEKVGKDSKIYKVVKVTPEPAEYAYYWSEYFEKSIVDKSIRLKNPSIHTNEENVQFTENTTPFTKFGANDQLVPAVSPSESSAWDKVREKK